MPTSFLPESSQGPPGWLTQSHGSWLKSLATPQGASLFSGPPLPVTCCTCPGCPGRMEQYFSGGMLWEWRGHAGDVVEGTCWRCTSSPGQAEPGGCPRHCDKFPNTQWGCYMIKNLRITLKDLPLPVCLWSVYPSKGRQSDTQREKDFRKLAQIMMETED